ncbi:MAG: hypothetical protein ACYC9Q_07505 [Bacillota bacterium]
MSNPAVRQQVKDKWAELNRLRTQIRDLDKQFGLGRRTGAAGEHRRFTDDTLKPLLQQLKDLARQLKAALAPMKPLKDQIHILLQEMRTLNGGLQADRRDAKDAMKQKDGAGVLAALDKAIAAEREVLAKKTVLLDLQKQVGTALQNAANSAK